MHEPPMLNEADRANFTTLTSAAKAGELALLSVLDRDGKPRAMVCAVNYDGETYNFVPLAVMIWDNPYAMFQPPIKTDSSNTHSGMSMPFLIEDGVGHA